MIEFIVRARAAPVAADRFLEAIGTGAGVEYLADIVRHAIFVSQGHREDTKITLVLEKSQFFSRVVGFGVDHPRFSCLIYTKGRFFR
ncbi:MAG: hypothetical protein ACNYPE_02355 [Candidatus Azotimanducaceae bacterium WSBS_2022_MAG_OTU7]